MADPQAALVATLEANVLQLQTTIKTHTETIAQRDATIAQMQTAAKIYTDTVALRDATIVQLQTEAAQRDTTIVQLQTEAKIRTDAIASRDVTIADLQTGVKNLQEEVKAQATALSQRDTALAQLQVSLAQKTAETMTKQVELQQAQQDAMSAGLLAGELARLKDQLVVKETELINADKVAHDAASSLQAAKKEVLAAQAAGRQDDRDKISALRGEVFHLRLDKRSLQCQIEALSDTNARDSEIDMPITNNRSGPNAPPSIAVCSLSLQEVDEDEIADRAEAVRSKLADYDKYANDRIEGSASRAARTTYFEPEQGVPQPGSQQEKEVEGGLTEEELAKLRDLHAPAMMKLGFESLQRSKQLQADLHAAAAAGRVDSKLLQYGLGNLLVDVQHVSSSLGLQNFKSMPVIIVGNESNGKSTLLDCLLHMRVTFHASNRATKAPVWYLLERSDEPLTCAVSTDRHFRDVHRRVPLREVPQLVQAHMDGIDFLSETKLYVSIRGRDVMYPGLFVDLPGLPIQGSIQAVGPGAAAANEAQRVYRERVQVIIQNTVKECDADGTLILCIERFDKEPSEGYFYPIVKEIFAIMKNPGHKVIPIRTHHDLVYGWGRDANGNIDRNGKLVGIDVPKLQRLYAAARDADDGRDFSFCVSLHGVPMHATADEMDDILKLNSEGLVRQYQEQLPHMDASALRGLDPEKHFSFSRLCEEIDQHRAHQVFASMAKFRALLLAFKSRIDVHARHFARIAQSTESINFAVVMDRFFSLFRLMLTGWNTMGLPQPPMDFDRSPELQIWHSKFPLELSYPDPDLPFQPHVPPTLADQIAATGARIRYPNHKAVLEALKQHVEHYDFPTPNLEMSFRRLVRGILVQLAHIQFLPPTYADMVANGSDGGSSLSDSSNPEMGYKRIVLHCMRVLQRQVCEYTRMVLRSFFKAAVDRTLWYCTKDRHSKHSIFHVVPGIAESYNSIGALQHQLYKGVEYFVDEFVDRLQKDVLDFPHLRMRSVSHAMEGLHESLGNILLDEILGNDQINVNSTAHEETIGRSLDKLTRSKIDFINAHNHASPSAPPPAPSSPTMAKLTEEKRLQFECMALFNTVHVEFMTRLRDLLHHQMPYRAFSQSAPEQRSLRSTLLNFVMGSVYSIRYKPAHTMYTPEKGDDDMDVSETVTCVGYRVSPEALNRYYLVGVEAERAKPIVADLKRVLEGVPARV
eukprot:m.193121 g.193121  ORF g.193121 m.193121 type:complete len:1206 (+) comp10068_c0_seq4:31-3648(+)